MILFVEFSGENYHFPVFFLKTSLMYNKNMLLMWIKLCVICSVAFSDIVMWYCGDGNAIIAIFVIIATIAMIWRMELFCHCWCGFVMSLGGLKILKRYFILVVCICMNKSLLCSLSHSDCGLWIVWSSSFYGFSNLVHCNQTQRPSCAEKDGIRVITPDKPRSSWKSLTSRTFDFLNERNLSCELQLIFGKVVAKASILQDCPFFY